ncbi:MAG: sel1 repeat family protein [Labilithrix sp.]|nr:sel1 repeat family protein [Labilithrix sp.]
MRIARPLRIPLQVGTSALLSLARASAFFVPGVILTGIAIAALVVVGDVFNELGQVGGFLVAVLVAPGLGLLGFAWKHARRAHAGRPSDLLLDGEGFVVVGGPHDRRRTKWADIVRVRRETPPKPNADAKDDTDDSDLLELCLYLKPAGVTAEERLVLAFADRAGEQRSLEELAKTLRAGRGKKHTDEKRDTDGKKATDEKNVTDEEKAADEKRQSDAKVDVALVCCPSCGAAVAPSVKETVTCAYCSADVPIAADIRARIRDADTLLARPDAAVAKLLEQPGAERVGVMFVGAAAFMLAAWPIALVLLARNYRERALTVPTALFVVLFLVACIVGFAALIRGRLVDRQALRLVTLDFAADAPAAPGDPFTCRSCFAPLPEHGDHVLVACVYCRAANILALELRREASAVRRQQSSLDEALAHRDRERRRWRGVTGGALLLIALAGFSLRHGFGKNPITWPLEQRCARGDEDACLDLADRIGHHPAPGVRPDRKRAVAIYERACDAGSGRACEAAAELWFDWMAAPGGSDAPRAVKLHARACDLGRPASCSALAAIYEKGALLARVQKDPAKAKAFYRRACELGDPKACDAAR